MRPDDERVGQFSDGNETLPDDERVGQFSDGRDSGKLERFGINPQDVLSKPGGGIPGI